MMLKILHVVSDDKFIDLLLPRYFHDGCENEIVYLREEFTYKGLYRDVAKWVKPFTKEFKALSRTSTGFDIIIVYNLNYDKAVFINALPKKPVIIWHFFGIEVYNHTKLSKYNLSERTRAFLQQKRKSFIEEKLNLALMVSRRILSGKPSARLELSKAMLAADYFAWYNKDEYDYLKSHVPALPEFLQLPITTKYQEPDHSGRNEIKIQVGNSSAPENNHIDILLLLQERQYKGKVILPFSYGYHSAYQEQFRQHLQKFSLNIRVLDDFIPYEDYLKLLGTITTAVFNSYRQMALGNIFILLFYGTKVYLSERNPTYPWLKKLGFYIYAVETNLEADLKSGELQLDEAQTLHNRALYTSLAADAGLQKFLALLPGLVKTR